MIGSTVKLAFDGSAVQRGFRKVGDGFKRLGKTMGNIGKAMLAPFVKLMAVLAPILTVGAFGKGIKDALDFGGAVSDLANRLGIAASEVVVLQEAFRRTGIESADVATTLQRMGKNVMEGLEMGTGLAARAIETLGLRAEDLQGLNLAEMFELFSTRIAGLESSAQQAQIAMAIFGREGGKLINLFKTSDAFDVARRSVGGLGATMDEAANKFDKVSDSLGALGLKFRQLFGAIAAQAIGPLNSISDFIDNLDLTGIGRKVGEFMVTLETAFRQGRFGELLWSGMSDSIDRLAATLEAAARFFAQEIAGAIDQTKIGKALNLGGLADNLEFGQAAAQSMLPGSLGKKGVARLNAMGDQSFGAMYQDAMGTRLSGKEIDRTAGLIQAMTARRQLDEHRRAGTDTKYLQSMERSLNAIERQFGLQVTTF